MSDEKQLSYREELIQNVLAGLTVSFVALSLGAAFGLLSGRGAFAGMISAAVIAFVVALIGGTRVQCSGPTGPMTAVTVMLVAQAFRVFENHPDGINPNHVINIAIILMGVLLMLFALFRLGRFISYIPGVVISGFMNGIAIIIWMDQFQKLMGWGGKIAIAGSLFHNTLLFVFSTGLMFVLPAATRAIASHYARFMSATILTLVIGTAFSIVLRFDVETVTLAASLKSVSDVVNLASDQFPTHWTAEVILFALPYAAQLAFLAYLDTLLTSLVVDKMTGEETHRERELFAQGVAGTIVAFIGGIPGAQATIRSVVIVKEHATWRLAGVLVGIFALVEMILFQDWIGMIPQAVFAGVLMKVGYDVFDWLPLRLYIKQLVHAPSETLYNFFSRHDDQPIYVTNREMLMIIGTTAVTAVWDLNFAVFIFTALFYIHNYVAVPHNPMRDLKPTEEAEEYGA